MVSKDHSFPEVLSRFLSRLLELPDCRFYSLLDHFRNLGSFHRGIFLVRNGRQINQPNRNPLNGIFVKRLKRIDQRTGHDRAFRFYGAFKGTALKRQELVSHLTPCPFRKNQEISPLFHFLRHRIDDFHGLADIFPVDHHGTQRTNHLL